MQLLQQQNSPDTNTSASLDDDQIQQVRLVCEAPAEVQEVKHISFKEFVASLVCNKSEEVPLPDDNFVKPLRERTCNMGSRQSVLSLSDFTEGSSGKLKQNKQALIAKTPVRSSVLCRGQQKIISFASPSESIKPLTCLQSESISEHVEVRNGSEDAVVPSNGLKITEFSIPGYDIKLSPFPSGLLVAKPPVFNRVIEVDRCLTFIQEEHRDFPVRSCFESLMACRKAAVSSQNSEKIHWLWTDKYAPNSCSTLLYNGHGIKKFQHWLQRWKFNAPSNTRNGKQTEVNRKREHSRCRKRIVIHPDDSSDEDFIPESRGFKRRRTDLKNHVPVESIHATHENPVRQPLNLTSAVDSSSSGGSFSDIEDGGDSVHSDGDSLTSGKWVRNSWRTKAYVLLGPPGTGKTALVYALANDLGFKLFELNPSARRSGKDILGQFQVALDSHHVAKEHLSSSFSTFHMTNSAKPKGASQRPRRSAANFFKPVSTPKSNKPPRRTSKEKKTALCAKSPKGLNLSCNSLVLIDEADVLFNSDRGFWSALSNLLQLARRPLVLTCSDPALLHNLPIPACVYHVREPSLNLVIPYLKLVCLAEGFELDTRTVLSLHGGNAYRLNIGGNVDLLPGSFTQIDVRRLVNQLQWFTSVTRTQPDASVESFDALVENPWMLCSDVLDSVRKLCPRFCSLQLSNEQPVSPTTVSPVTSISNDLADVFRDASDETTLCNSSKPSFVQPPDLECPAFITKLSMPPSVQLCGLLRSCLTLLHFVVRQQSIFDFFTSSLSRSYTTHILDFTDLSSGPSSTSSDKNDMFTEDTVYQPPSTTSLSSCSTANVSRLSQTGPCTKSTHTVTVNPVMANLLAPIAPFGQDSEQIENHWSNTLFGLARSRLPTLERELMSILPEISMPSVHETPIEVNPSPYTDSYSTQLISELAQAGVGSRHLIPNPIRGRRELACDYLPCLRLIASGEVTKQEVSTSRRFLHYFDRINLFLRRSTRDKLCRFQMGTFKRV
ncbi:hypothetical protein EG68_07283 [Paragonimus skrjabini miyazakii]|uniref:AAA+ ATPase domain-containing protein n=1 Tax=Paragonimus skrjabini miyazakii TaxID=59628 RepID=A0A8S9YM72_9TREM|nr:hypothetical protein EG68_07283 [Paragonimus skrjabini miyazakii]